MRLTFSLSLSFSSLRYSNLGYKELTPSTVTGLARAFAGARHAGAHIGMRIRRTRRQALRPQPCGRTSGSPHAGRQAGRQAGRWAGRQAGWWAGGQASRQVGRQAGRQASKAHLVMLGGPAVPRTAVARPRVGTAFPIGTRMLRECPAAGVRPSSPPSHHARTGGRGRYGPAVCSVQQSRCRPIASADAL